MSKSTREIAILTSEIATQKKASSDEILTLLKTKEVETLFATANAQRQKKFGKTIILRGIVEFSSFCSCPCSYCGLNSLNSDLQRFRMTESEILNAIKVAYQAGYRAVVLQSGEDPFYTGDTLSAIIKVIKKQYPDLILTLSVGERSTEEYKQWKKDGANRYLLKHETANPIIYKNLHPHANLKQRIQHLETLKSLGYETGSGFMVGLPGQQIEDLVEDILLIKALNLDMAGIGIFIPHPKTPLKNVPEGNPLEAMKALSIVRLLMENIHLPSTTSIETSQSTHFYEPLSCGANVIMKKVEPYIYRKLYEIYPNPNLKETSVEEDRITLEHYIKSIGLNAF